MFNEYANEGGLNMRICKGGVNNEGGDGRRRREELLPQLFTPTKTLRHFSRHSHRGRFLGTTCSCQITSPMTKVTMMMLVVVLVVFEIGWKKKNVSDAVLNIPFPLPPGGAVTLPLPHQGSWILPRCEVFLLRVLGGATRP